MRYVGHYKHYGVQVAQTKVHSYHIVLTAETTNIQLQPQKARIHILLIMELTSIVILYFKYNNNGTDESLKKIPKILLDDNNNVRASELMYSTIFTKDWTSKIS